MFNPNSRESCEYYGVPFKGERLVQRDNPYYYGDQSRDHALSNTIKCRCTTCAVNKNGYCEVPSLISINANGECETGKKFMEVRR